MWDHNEEPNETIYRATRDMLVLVLVCIGILAIFVVAAGGNI